MTTLKETLKLSLSELARACEHAIDGEDQRAKESLLLMLKDLERYFSTTNEPISDPEMMERYASKEAVDGCVTLPMYFATHKPSELRDMDGWPIWECLAYFQRHGVEMRNRYSHTTLEAPKVFQEEGMQWMYAFSPEDIKRHYGD